MPLEATPPSQNPVEQMKRVLTDATARPPMNPEIRAQTVALLCVADWLDRLDRRLRTIEQGFGRR